MLCFTRKPKMTKHIIFTWKYLLCKDIQCCSYMLFLCYGQTKANAYTLMKFVQLWNYQGQANGYRLVASLNYIFNFPYSVRLRNSDADVLQRAEPMWYWRYPWWRSQTNFRFPGCAILSSRDMSQIWRWFQRMCPK